jgi:glycosyltransferase involved in cell wall biosynthesis
LLVDISAIVQNDLKTGIQRVVRALLLELIKAPPDGYSVEPVYMTDADGYWHYLYARRYTLGLLGCPQDWLADDHLEARVGDLLLTLDLTGGLVVEAEKAGVYRELKMVGLDFWFVVYDILPILSPEKFPPNTSPVFREWLMSVCRLADGVLCISRSVANEFTEFLKEADIKRLRPLKPHWFHLGADVKSSVPSLGLPMDAPQVLESLTARPTFLMVGTIEPRKGHPQTLTAFDLLWQQGVDVNLVIVGKEGWMMEDLADSIRDHDNFEKQLFWLDSISDEYLEEIYKATTCLIAASEGEGFGLPLIEAAQHKISIIARDIPVFKEVAGEYAFYFAGLKPDDIASAVKQWLANSEKEQVPRSDAMPWLTWKQSSQQLIDVVLNSGVEFGLRAKAAQPDDVIVQNEMPISQFTETSYGATRADQFDETTANILSLPETARTLSRQAKAKRKKR